MKEGKKCERERGREKWKGQNLVVFTLWNMPENEGGEEVRKEIGKGEGKWCGEAGKIRRKRRSLTVST